MRARRRSFRQLVLLAWGFAAVLHGADAAPAAAPAEERLAAGTREFRVQSGGHEWLAVVQVPEASLTGAPRPLVLVLHGAGGNGRAYLEKNGWKELAERENVIVVAPDGQTARPELAPSFLLNPRLWNSGQLRAGSPRSKLDDCAALNAILQHVMKRTNANPAAVFCTGHSNGASMTFALAVAADAGTAPRLAAIAPVASHCFIEPGVLKRPVPTLYVIGTVDPLVPLAGGERTLPWGASTVPPVRDTLTTWAKALGCADQGRSETPRDGVKVLTFPGPVSYRAVFISGQGHGWPGGGESGLPERSLGPSVKTYDATREIWAFFKSCLGE